MKIAICTPVYGDTKRRFTDCLAELLIYSGREAPHLELTFQSLSMSNLPLSRTRLAAGALAWKADWILWLDADQTFPRDTLLRLLAHSLPVVGCNCPLRDNSNGCASAPYGEGGSRRFRTTTAGAAESPLLEVDSLGLAVCLVRATIFAELPQPWFELQMGLGNDYLGEDYYFFRKVRKNGDKVFIDQQLSLQIGHIAETEHRFS